MAANRGLSDKCRLEITARFVHFAFREEGLYHVGYEGSAHTLTSIGKWCQVDPGELLSEDLDLVTSSGSRCSHACRSPLVLCAGLSQCLFDAWFDIAFGLAANRG